MMGGIMEREREGQGIEHRPCSAGVHTVRYRALRHRVPVVQKYF